jgi:hypothetical protein
VSRLSGRWAGECGNWIVSSPATTANQATGSVVPRLIKFNGVVKDATGKAFVTTDSQTASAQAGTSAAATGPSASAKPGQGVHRDSAASSTNQSTASVGTTGTTNFIPRWTNSTTLGNSLLFQMGANVGLGTITPPGSLRLIPGTCW